MKITQENLSLIPGNILEIPVHIIKTVLKLCLYFTFYTKRNLCLCLVHSQPLVLTEGKGLHPGDGRDGQDLKQRSDNGKLPFHTNYTLTTFNLFNIHLQFTGLQGYIYI